MIKIIGSILIGGLIGYCTNYIAIKMLFRPRHEVFIGSLKMPFSPGVIPKNQKRIASAVGNAVSEQLLTKEDLTKQLAEGGFKEKIADTIAEYMVHSTQIHDLAANFTKKLPDTISADLVQEIEDMDFMPVIRNIGSQALQDYLKNPMLSMFLNESVLEKVYQKIEDSVKAYLHENGEAALNEFIQRKVDSLQDTNSEDALSYFGITKADISEKLSDVFDEFMESKGGELLDEMDIRGIVTSKIENMPVEDLEELVMYVMKNELQAVINLGAVIGALIGIVNIFI